MDDTGFADIGYQSAARAPPRVQTPRIDALAAASIKLTQYYVQGSALQPICTGSMI